MMNARISFGLLTLFAFTAHECAAQSTAFTYQGRLNEGVNPANGHYDLQFILFSTNQFGFPAGPILTNASVLVNNGLFTVALDFGAGVFPGADRWLEIGVRTNGNGSFATLVPRQPLTPTPYAITAANVTPGSGFAGTYGGAVTLSNANNAFTGTFNGNGVGISNVNAVTLDGLSAANFWKTGGNAGTSAGADFVGTTDNQPLELRVNSQRGLRLEPGGSNSINVIGGNAANSVAAGIAGATVSGGGAGNFNGAGVTNRADANFATVAGGGNNSIQGNAVSSTVSGGARNIIQSNAFEAAIGGGSGNLIGASASQATIGGGANNSALGLQATIGGGYANSTGGGAIPDYDPFINFGLFTTIGGGGANYIAGGNQGATIAGGLNNLITGGSLQATIGGGKKNVATNATWASVGGGVQNVAVGDYATIPGGALNTAGLRSFAAGSRAKATNQGAFVWADSQNADFISTSNNQFLVRAAGGVGINTNRPGATLDVNGSLRVGSGTTIFSNLQGGVAQMATDSTSVKTNFTFTFPKAFTSVPNVLVSARSASDVDDTFAVTVRRVTATTCTVNVVRTDVAAGWGQHVQVTWMAWE